MSANKLKYWTVTSTQVVQANNKADAVAISRGRRGITGRVLVSDNSVERITASEAHGLVAEATA